MEKNKYSVIYADPPWDQKAGRPLSGGYKKEKGVQVWNPVNNSSQKLPYPTMTLSEIESLPIRDIAADNAHLYIWVTNKFLPDVHRVIKSWGFKYSTTLVWCKKPFGGGLGGAYRITTEYLVFARRGNLKTQGTIKSSWFEVKRPYVEGAPCHSKKPDFFRNIIEEISPGNKIELFARSRHDGWDAWGNEIESDITL